MSWPGVPTIEGYARGGYVTNPPTITPRESRQASVSFICHLATVRSFFAHHHQCDGKSYTPSIVDKGIPCTCTCHTAWAAA